MDHEPNPQLCVPFAATRERRPLSPVGVSYGQANQVSQSQQMQLSLKQEPNTTTRLKMNAVTKYMAYEVGGNDHRTVLSCP